MSSCNWKTLVPFCLQEKRPENTFLILIWNYHPIAQINKLCHPKQQYIGFLMTYDVIYSLLVLTEILVLFSKVVRAYYILNVEVKLFFLFSGMANKKMAATLGRLSVN